MPNLEAPPGKLCVSIIEARNVAAEDITEPQFYVRLRLGTHEVKTDVVKDSISPKFLKDARVDVDHPETDVLRVELLQVGPHGDLVIGRSALRVLAFTSKGTVVHWLSLKLSEDDDDVGAELCLVMRYLSAHANRPMSPSYAIAARTAKERAVAEDSSSSSPIGLKPFQGSARQLFQDAPDTPTRAVPTNVRGSEVAKHVSAIEARTTGSTGGTGGTAQYSAPSTVQRESSVSSTTSAVVPPSSVPTPRSRSRSGRGEAVAAAAAIAGGGGQRAGSDGVPLPLAILSGLLAGAVVFFLKKRPTYYAVHEGDTLSTLGTAMQGNSRKSRRLFENRSRDILDDLNLVFPGDRLRIR